MLPDLEELLERSIFHAIREKTVAEGYLPNINTFDISNVDDSIAEQAKADYETAKTTIYDTKGFVIDIFGVSNNQSKAEKKIPRIVIDTQSFQPGTLGGDTTPIYNLVDGVYVKSSSPSLASDFFFNVYIVCNTVKQLRVLTAIVSAALPRRGYVKTYLADTIEPFGNLLTVFLSSSNSQDLPEGVFEKAFSYEVPDVFESLPDTIVTIVDEQVFDIVPIIETNLVSNLEGVSSDAPPVLDYKKLYAALLADTTYIGGKADTW